MSVTTQSAAINWANQVIALSAQMKALESAILLLQTNESYGDPKSVVGSFATASLNADGSLGAADGTPNPAHPIDTRVTAQSGVANAVTFNNLQNAYGCLQDMLAAIQGTRTVPQVDRRTGFYSVSGI